MAASSSNTTITSQANTVRAWDPRYMDPSYCMDPKKPETWDFYKYANGAWTSSATIEPGKTGNGTFYELDKQVLSQMLALFDKLNKTDVAKLSPQQLTVRNMHISAANQELRNKVGLDPIANLLAMIGKSDSPGALMASLITLHKDEVQAFLGWQTDTDANKPAQLTFHLDDGGTHLTSPAQYKDPKKVQGLRDYITKLLTQSGWPSGNINSAADAVIKIEETLAASQLDPKDKLDPTVTSNFRKQSELDPEIRSFLNGLGIAMDPIQVMNPKFVQTVAQILRERPLEDIKAYLTFCTLDSFAPYLTEDYVKLHFDFHRRFLQGVEKPKPVEETLMACVEVELRELLSEVWVKEYYTKDNKAKALKMADVIHETFVERISQLPWWSPETRPLAVEKAQSVLVNLCFPDDGKWKDYSGLGTLDPTAPLVENIRLARKFNVSEELRKVGTPTDRQVWLKTPWPDNFYYACVPHEANAYDDFGRVAVYFPQAFLLPPMSGGDDPSFFGAFGAILAHELYHSIDTTGCHYDPAGKVTNWWTKHDTEEFKKRAAATAAQFSEYSVSFSDGSSLKVNGELTLRENLSDLGGALVAFDAMKRYMQGRKVELIDGVTPEQAFFLSYAQTWRSISTEQSMKNRIQFNEHAPPYWRVNGTLTQMPAFRTTYGTPPKGSPMYLPPELRSTIWGTGALS